MASTKSRFQQLQEEIEYTKDIISSVNDMSDLYAYFMGRLVYLYEQLNRIPEEYRK